MFDAVPEVQNREVIDIQKERDLLEARQTELVEEWLIARSWAITAAKSPHAWLRAVTGVSKQTASRMINRAQTLFELPLVRSAYFAGDVTTDRVDVLVSAYEKGIHEFFIADQELLLGFTGTDYSFPAFSLEVAEWKEGALVLAGIDKDGKAFNDRSCNYASTLDGVVVMHCEFDAIGGEIKMNENARLEKILLEEDWKEAQDSLGVERPALTDLRRNPTQRRADAEVLMAMRSASADGGKSWVVANVVLGSDAFAAACRTAHGTVISPNTVVPYLDMIDIERVVFDSRSKLVDLGRRVSFVGSLERVIKLRDQWCQADFCDEPAWKCECDHIDPRSNGGLTVAENGQALCGFHNRQREQRDQEPADLVPAQRATTRPKHPRI